jgi:hypothetical protein
MSESENFLTRWSRLKRESDAAPETEPVPAPACPDPAASAEAAVEEPPFDLASLPSLDSIGAKTDVSMFMQPGVPASLRHAALRRAWTSDPAVRDFRGLQENDWDFTASEGVPGFGAFKSESEIRELAQRLFRDDRRDPEPVPQSAPQDSGDAPGTDCSGSDAVFDKDRDMLPAQTASNSNSSEGETASAVQRDGTAVQRGPARRHGGALPQ